MRILMNRADRAVSDEIELGREKEHIRKALQVNGYLDWMLVDSRMSNQLDPGQEEEEELKEGEGMRRKKWRRECQPQLRNLKAHGYQ